MAISIITSPDLYQPVYNPIYTEVSSTLTSEESFSFLFDTYVNGVFVVRDRLLPRPGTTRAIFSPARILESYVSYDLTHNIVGQTPSVNCIDKYDIKLGEEYIKYWNFLDTQYDSFSASSYTLLTGTSSATHSFVTGDYIIVENTLYGSYNAVHKIVNVPNNYNVVINKNFTVTATNSGRATWSDKRKSEFFTATQSGYAFNGVIQYEEVPVWDYMTYSMSGNTASTGIGTFLTKQPTVKTTLTDRGSIGYLNIGATAPSTTYFLDVSGTDINNNPISSLSFTLSYFGTSVTNQKIIELPAYPWNLNQMSQANYGMDVITASSSNYTLSLWASDPVYEYRLSEIKTFELDTCGTRFNPVRFMFLNSLGQFDYFNATLLSRTSVSISRDTYTKTLAHNYTQGDRGKTVINVNAQEKTTITTDWISEATAHWLTTDFVTSEEIYTIDNTTGKITPIILEVGDWEDKKKVNDKLLNYTISYSKAVAINTKRN